MLIEPWPLPPLWLKSLPEEASAQLELFTCVNLLHKQTICYQLEVPVRYVRVK